MSSGSLRGGISVLVQGPPGTGKSWFLGSSARVGKAKLLAFRPKEIDSVQYIRHGINEDAELFHDPRWMPSIEKYEATGFVKLMHRLFELQEDDEYDIVIVDPLTDVGELIGHQLMSVEGAATPKEMDNAIGFYGDLRKKWSEFTKALVALNYAKKPKHVLAAIHTKPTNEEDMKGKATKDAKAKGSQYFGDVLPMVEGSFKYDMSGEFHVSIFTEFSTEWNRSKREFEEKYEIQVRPTNERHSKISLAPSLTNAALPNDFETFMKTLEEARAA